MKRIVFLLSLLTTTAFAQERTESLKSFEVSFGATFPTSRAYDNKSAHYTFGLGYVWDIDTAFIEVRLDHADRFSDNPTQRYTSVTLGGNYIMIDEQLWALFGGLNLGLGFAKVSGIDMKGGFHVGGDVGALFLREADVNLDTRIRISYNTLELRDSHPFFVGFIVGIHF